MRKHGQLVNWQQTSRGSQQTSRLDCCNHNVRVFAVRCAASPSITPLKSGSLDSVGNHRGPIFVLISKRTGKASVVFHDFVTVSHDGKHPGNSDAAMDAMFLTANYLYFSQHGRLSVLLDEGSASPKVQDRAGC
jgi:hypothetical protein